VDPDRAGLATGVRLFDEERALIAKRVRDVVGDQWTLVFDPVDVATLFLGGVLEHVRTLRHPQLIVACLTGASACDALTACRRDLLAVDYQGLFMSLRRAMEMDLLCAGVWHDERLALDWLAGKSVEPRRLRALFDDLEPEGVGRKELYDDLSQGSHGRSPSIARYGNAHGRMEWPLVAESLDKDMLLNAFDRVVGSTSSHLEAVGRLADQVPPGIEEWVEFYREQRGFFSDYEAQHSRRPDGSVTSTSVLPNRVMDWVALPARPQPTGGDVSPSNGAR